MHTTQANYRFGLYKASSRSLIHQQFLIKFSSLVFVILPVELEVFQLHSKAKLNSLFMYQAQSQNSFVVFAVKAKTFGFALYYRVSQQKVFDYVFGLSTLPFPSQYQNIRYYFGLELLLQKNLDHSFQASIIGPRAMYCFPIYIYLTTTDLLMMPDIYLY